MLVRLYGVAVCMYGIFILFKPVYAQDNPLRSVVIEFSKDALPGIADTTSKLNPFAPASPQSTPRSIFMDLTNKHSSPSHQSADSLWPTKDTNPFKTMLTTDTNESKQLTEIISVAKKSPSTLIKGTIAVGKTFIVVLVIYDNAQNAVTLYYSDRDSAAVSNVLSRTLINLPATVYAAKQTAGLAPIFVTKATKSLAEKLASQGRTIALRNAKLGIAMNGTKTAGKTLFKTLGSFPVVIITSVINFVQLCADRANQAHDIQKNIDILEKSKCTSADMGALEKEINEIEHLEYSTESDRALRSLKKVQAECRNITEQIDDLIGEMLELKNWVRNTRYCLKGMV